MGVEVVHHVFMVSYPGQGHINPLLRLAKCLASKGLYVTFSTTHNAGNMMIQNSSSSDDDNDNNDSTINFGKGQLRFEFFSDGWEDDEPKCRNLDAMIHQLETVGRDSLIELINKQAEAGRPVTCLINNPFLYWVSDVAMDMGIPCALLWVESCAVFSTFYHYLYDLASFPAVDQPDLSVDLPGLPTLQPDEIPRLLNPFNSLIGLRNAVLKQFKNLSKSFCVLVESFEELEWEAIKPMTRIQQIRPVGPLTKFPYESNTSLRGDMWNSADECIEWLDAQRPASVVYVSFGSIVVLGNDQMEETARGLLNSGLPFLWVVKQPSDGQNTNNEGKIPDGFIREAEGKGLIVQWCPQDQVLAHPSVICFVTHCGWNSSIEALSCGVPVVAFPQFGDQVTNAKFLVDVYGVGVRLGRSLNDMKTFSREKLETCLIEVTRGPKAKEIKKNALKWKKAAEGAVAEGGSSEKNLQAFVNEIRRMVVK